MTHLYDLQKVIFTLNSMANAPSGRHGSVEELEQYATTVINKVFADPGVVELIGEWQLVWGPAVYQSDSDVADNAMYVAQKKSDLSQFVVAISGTNPISAYGWIDEDIMINPPVPWPYGDGNSDAGNITQGTSVGLNVLLNLLKSQHPGSANQSLMEYLGQQVASSDSALSITVTGHSLGGALSPSTALALLDTQGIATDWDPDSKSNISVLASAGPTPGDETWRNYYDRADKLGNTPEKKKTDRLWNHIDIVPHAWQISMLQKIPTIYVPAISENCFVAELVKLAILNSKLAGNIQQILPDTIPLPGTVDTSITISIKNIIVILETLLANDVIDKLAVDLTADELALLKAAIDELIKYLNSLTDQTATMNVRDLTAATTPSLAAIQSDHQSISDSLTSFLDFLVQVAHQHTTAYSQLIGTTAFDAIYDSIKVQVD